MSRSESSRSGYSVPSASQRTETIVANSRFIATVSRVNTTDEAKLFLAQIRAEMTDASHHVYAYRVGYGNSTIEGVSDDGEPSGTAGPPVLSVLRGTKIGDVIIVVTRYFGGTKLGTGGLVRAYTEAAHIAFNSLAVEEKIDKILLGIEISYPFYEQIKRLITASDGQIQDETFLTDVTLMVEFPKAHVAQFTRELSELTAGRIQPVVME
jgi:uncharacterized YigZ family protein